MNSGSGFVPTTIQGERRWHRRYAIELDMRYKTLGKQVIEGSGRTLDLSSGGVSFSVGQAVPSGLAAELWIDWPVALNGISLRLVVFGKIVRSASDRAALRMYRHEFRLAGRLCLS